MDELKLVAKVFAEADPTPEAAADGRARFLRHMSDASERAGRLPRHVGDAPVQTRRVPFLRRLARRSKWPVGGLALAAALAMVFTLVAGIPFAGPADARGLLLTAAEGSEGQPAQGRYIHYEVETAGITEVGTPNRPYRMLVRRIDARWYPSSSNDTGWYSFRKLGAQPATGTDAEVWRAAGSPQRMESRCEHARVYKNGKLMPPRPCLEVDVKPQEAEVIQMSGGLEGFLKSRSGLDVSTLPDDPALLRERLLAWTRGGGLSGPIEGDADQLWAAAGVVLFQPEGPLSPTVRAAVYRMLADLPGVRLLGQVTDPKGRQGQAFTRTADGPDSGMGTSRIILDPETGQSLAMESYERPDGPLTGYTAVLASGPTDTPPTAS
ncbi:CU044_5270 family protein [Nonomuraea glycinis]|uniref:CU044_5270 family protein n=1 Tax=Nonomuraea glycinis TaxID=2047744 RepID=UPI002E152C7B|nr:CU044_5270 family protein [Nonomuraea glycinis]